MDEVKFRVLRDQVGESWKRLEQHRLAYSASSKATKKKADKLNWTTVILGGLTGVSGLLSVVPAVGLSTAVTALIGVGTGVAVTLKQTFNWEEKAKKFWDCFIEIDNAERELQRYISDVAMYGEARVDPVYIQKLDEKLKGIYSTQIDNLDHYEGVAEGNLKKHFISTLSMAAAQVQAAAQMAAEEAMAGEEAAAGIKPMVRGEADGLSPEE